MISVSACGDGKVTVALNGQVQTYSDAEWSTIWLGIAQDLIAGKPVTLPVPQQTGGVRHGA